MGLWNIWDAYFNKTLASYGSISREVFGHLSSLFVGECTTKLKVFSICFTLAVENTVRAMVFSHFKLIKISLAVMSFIYVLTHVVFLWCQIRIFTVLFKIKRRIRQEQMPSTEFHKNLKMSLALLHISLCVIFQQDRTLFLSLEAINFRTSMYSHGVL